jgi:transforming growth factor-beta-induced protein
MVAMAIPGDGELSIAENLAADARFSLLLLAAENAGLDTVLADCEIDPVTLFAPTNDAFDALLTAIGEDAWDALLNDPDALAAVLSYHLLPTVVESGDLPAPGNSTSVTTLNGQDILIEVIAGDPNQVRINGVAFVIEVDYDACNGIIHVIDRVLVPETEEECQTIAEIAAADGRFTTLLAAAGIAGLDDELADPDFGPVTLFAPTDTAFAALKAALGDDAWNALLADPATLGNVLLFHLLEGRVYSSDLPAPGNSIVAPTLLGQDLLIEVTSDGVLINGVAMVIQTDIDACNGVIHVIDAVLVPELDAPTVPTTPPPAEESTPTPVPVLPATGIGPDSSLPWQTLVLVALSLGLAYTALRKYAIARS